MLNISIALPLIFLSYYNFSLILYPMYSNFIMLSNSLTAFYDSDDLLMLI